jgi:hypothetical protein
MVLYDQDALRRIANAIGRCLDGQDQREMLERIEQAAQDLTCETMAASRKAAARSQLEAVGADPELIAFVESGWSDHPGEPSHADDKKNLRKLAELVREAHQLSRELSRYGALHLESATIERGCSQPNYLTEYAAAAEDAAGAVDVKSRGDIEFRDFISTIARIVEHFAGWSGVYTVGRVYSDGEDDIVDEARYSGRFFEVVKACIEPLGIRKGDAALAKAISRALAKDRSSD